MPPQRTLKAPKPATKKLRRLLSFGRSAKGSRTVEFAESPIPDMSAAALTAQQQLAVSAFLAMAHKSVAETPAVAVLEQQQQPEVKPGITRAQTCPNLSTLETRHVSLAARKVSDNILQPRPRPVIRIRTGDANGPSPIWGEEKKAAAAASPSASDEDPQPRCVSRVESAVGETSPVGSAAWSIFRSPWSFASRATIPENCQANSPLRFTGEGGETATEKEEDGLCESPKFLAPEPNSSVIPFLGNFGTLSSLSTLSRPSRHHSRVGSGARLRTPESSAGSTSISSSSSSSSGSGSSISRHTASSSVSRRSIRAIPSEANLNRRFDSASRHTVPFWYIRKPVASTEDGDEGGALEMPFRTLCLNCRHIDLDALFRQDESDVLPPPRDFIVMGTLLSLMTRTNCRLCQLAARIIAHDASSDISADLSDEARSAQQMSTLVDLLDETYYLCPARLPTPRNSPELFFFSSEDVRAGSWPRRSMAIRPIDTGTEEYADGKQQHSPSTTKCSGRLLRSPSEMDLDWVRDRLRACEQCSRGTEPAMDKRDHQQQHHPVRVIDVQNMCLVDLHEDDRYVALSYVCGAAAQGSMLLLGAASERALRHPKGLLHFWDSVPRTIQDAIKLVREIGERHLWVDALWIVAHALHHYLTVKWFSVPTHTTHLNDAYGEITASALTVCACGGDDATHGLPGVEPGTRKHSRQVVEMVGGQMIGSVMSSPYHCDATGKAGKGQKGSGKEGNKPSGNKARRGPSQWDTRAWTLQEQVLSPRRLLVTDQCLIWCCPHGQTVEDENGPRCGDYNSGTDTEPAGCQPVHMLDRIMSACILGGGPALDPRPSNMDVYARIVSAYTSRDLSDARDAERAIMGLLRHLEPAFMGPFTGGLPETELGAALMWCPLGSTLRRLDPASGEPIFPSWSWLGWTGQAAYPWLEGRTMPMSEEAGSPLLWRNMAPVVEDAHDAWFTGSDLRLNGLPHPASHGHVRDGWTYTDTDNENKMRDCDDGRTGGRWLNPVLPAPEGGGGGRIYQFFSAKHPHRLHFRTLAARFVLEDMVRVREATNIRGDGGTKQQQLVHVVRVLNDRGFAAGYIYAGATTAQDRTWTPPAGSRREFVVLSRASTRPDPRVGQELLHATPLGDLASVYSMESLLGGGGGGGGGVHRLRAPKRRGSDCDEQHHDEAAHFDTRLYDAGTPWGLFNVMMIEWQRKKKSGPKSGDEEEFEDVAERITVGRIHVAAFMEAAPVEKYVVLE
ncbi:hypothetical protein MAPG_09315 [Magnaporthiopsis poae ATCC 64411]|uniref:Heterokaryon incompatibility domain-containing protein n=1 Tax=Magnaporthiopsis poae (strain ATCC 64411 / 73-15) TaxID=644358 RepID=A0A0C4E9L9_MAGP6|nr:hypothetical protein MAPG_09315 [Magnaporthiopsis poae ATCC 64411]